MAYSLCGRTVANTGQQDCDKSRGVIKKLAIFNGEIAGSDYATEAALAAKLISNSKLSKDDANKLFPINEAQDVADTSEANKEGSLGLGFKTVLIEGKPAYTLKVFAGSDLVKRLRKFNNQTVRVLEFDANGTVWGVKSNGKFKGFQAKIFVTGNKAATGQNVEEGVATITVSFLSTSEYFDNAYWAEFTGNLEDIVGLLDVKMTYVSAASNVHKIRCEIEGSDLIGAYNVGPDVGSAIAALVANFSATMNGSAITITTITYNSTEQVLVVTYNSVTYSGGATGQTMELIPPTVAQLDAGDVTETELLKLTYTRP